MLSMKRQVLAAGSQFVLMLVLQLILGIETGSHITCYSGNLMKGNDSSRLHRPHVRLLAKPSLNPYITEFG